MWLAMVFWVAAAGYGPSVTRLSAAGGGRAGGSAPKCNNTEPSRCPLPAPARRHQSSLAGGAAHEHPPLVLAVVGGTDTLHSSSRLLPTTTGIFFRGSQHTGNRVHGAAAILALRPLECGHSMGCWGSANSKRFLECGWLPSWSHIL